MLDVTILKNVLLVAVASSIISTSLIQRIKEGLTKKYMPIYSLIISMCIGFCFALSFSDLNIIDALWVGLISYIGADAIYKLFVDKIFSNSSSIDDVIVIERNDSRVS